MSDPSQHPLPPVDVLCVGDTLGVYYQRLGGLYKRDIGGHALLVALAVARMGGQAALWSGVGDDAVGHEARRLCENDGVDTTGLASNGAVTPHIIADRDGAGLLQAGPVHGGAAPAASYDSVPVARARVVHLTLASADRGLLNRAQAAGALISLDLNTSHAAHLATAALSMADVVFADADQAGRMFGTSTATQTADVIAALGAKLVLVHGPNGLCLHSGGAPLILPAETHSLPIDAATAARVGTFLSSLTAGEDLGIAATRAEQAAALATVQAGWAAAIPALEDLVHYGDSEITPSAARLHPMNAGP